MKGLLLFLFGLLFAVGCASTPTPLPELHARVVKADKDWAEFNAHQMPKLWRSGVVARERKMYDKVRQSGVPDWRVRRAAWNYIVAVNEARVPDLPKPPGRGTPQNDPFN